MASTYLITGGAGFIGRQLSTELLSYGHSVRVIDSLIPQVHGDTDPPLAGVDFYEGDIRDANLVDRALAGTDGVFHLAAEVGVGQSMYEIARYVGGNDLGTAVLLERLANNPVARLVVASSMSVYGRGFTWTQTVNATVSSVAPPIPLHRIGIRPHRTELASLRLRRMRRNKSISPPSTH